jgi:hypothetical protein
MLHMALPKFIKISIVLVILPVVVIAIIAINHPIFLKWCSGTARVVGKPITATIYADGKVNSAIKLFHVDKYWDGTKADYYLLNFSYADTKDSKEIISLNRQDNNVGRPVSLNKQDYDMIFGALYQSEVGSKFSSFKDDMKGYNFDPHLLFTDSTITFNLPPTADQYKYDSIKIELFSNVPQPH